MAENLVPRLWPALRSFFTYSSPNFLFWKVHCPKKPFLFHTLHGVHSLFGVLPISPTAKSLTKLWSPKKWLSQLWLVPRHTFSQCILHFQVSCSCSWLFITVLEFEATSLVTHLPAFTFELCNDSAKCCSTKPTCWFEKINYEQVGFPKLSDLLLLLSLMHHCSALLLRGQESVPHMEPLEPGASIPYLGRKCLVTKARLWEGWEGRERCVEGGIILSLPPEWAQQTGRVFSGFFLSSWQAPPAWQHFCSRCARLELALHAALWAAAFGVPPTSVLPRHPFP